MTASELRPENNALAARSLLERVTGIEPALSAWEAVPSGPVTWPDLRDGLSASDRERPLVAEVIGTLMHDISADAAGAVDCWHDSYRLQCSHE
jgi:hypothetical protein